MNKKILTITSIVFALVFILLMAMLFNSITDTGNDAVDTFGSTKEAIMYNELKAFDNKEVSGSTVINTINSMRETKSGMQMRYAVCNSTTQNSSTYWAYYGYGGLSFTLTSPYITVGAPTSTYKTYTVTDVTNTHYINEANKYTANLLKTSNGVVTGIKFIKK